MGEKQHTTSFYASFRIYLNRLSGSHLMTSEGSTDKQKKVVRVEEVSDKTSASVEGTVFPVEVDDVSAGDATVGHEVTITENDSTECSSRDMGSFSREQSTSDRSSSIASSSDVVEEIAGGIRIIVQPGSERRSLSLEAPDPNDVFFTDEWVGSLQAPVSRKRHSSLQVLSEDVPWDVPWIDGEDRGYQRPRSRSTNNGEPARSRKVTIPILCARAAAMVSRQRFEKSE